MVYLIYFLCSCLLSYLFFVNYKKIASKFKLIDSKNLHYSHSPTPTGSGIFFSVYFFIVNLVLYIIYGNNLILYFFEWPNKFYIFIISGLVLSIISYFDDIKSIDPILRLLSQIVFVYISIVCLNLENDIFPFKVTILITVGLWIYLLNLTNFLDGADGFLITNFLIIILQILAIYFFFNLTLFSYVISLILLPLVLMFLMFNKPPAKLFMGDAGSIFLGFICGFFFLEFTFSGNMNLAISLFSYFLVDCTICIIKKLKKGIMPWIGMYDYYFLIPVLKSKKNHLNVLILLIIYGIINSLIIYIQLATDNKIFCIFSLILSFVLTQIFKHLNDKLSFLKISK